MTEKDFILPLNFFNTELSGTVTAKSPSNIALVKYWGKTYPQIPANPSVSFTLSESLTSTRLHFSPTEANEQAIKVILNGEYKPSFVPKIRKFFEIIDTYAPYLKYYDFIVETENSFPHSSGIASSASGMSALAKCLIRMEEKLGHNTSDEALRASFLARLGSGSACRSVFNGLAAWGKSEFIPQSSDLYAVPLSEGIHPVFETFRDTVLLIHEGSKSVSSTAGHDLMNDHPYAKLRFEEASSNISVLLKILASGDLTAFGQLVEHEALSLHAMMLMSNPPYLLMMPETVAVINKVWEFRKTSGLHLYFTLDAGANVHLLYPESENDKIRTFIQSDLLSYCQNGKAIYDRVNFG